MLRQYFLLALLFSPGGSLFADYNAGWLEDSLRLKVRSWVHADSNRFSDLTDQRNRIGLRRARVAATLNYREKYSIKADYDFVNKNLTPRDLLLAAGSKSQALQLGHFKEPYGLEEQTSSTNTNLIERFSGRTFHPVRNSGLLYRGNPLGENSSFALGVFNNTGDHLQQVNNNYSIACRLTALISESERELTHLGLGLRHYRIIDDPVSFGSRPGSFFADPVIQTPAIFDGNSNLLNFEFLKTRSNHYLQSEIIANWVEDNQQRINFLNSYYLQLGTFLTGERKSYNHRRAILNDLTDFNHAHGALEVVLRYSVLDLNSRQNFGELRNYTLGTNWYIKNYLKLMLNYIYQDSDTTGDNNILLTRIQLTLP